MAHGELAWLFLEPDTGLDNCPKILLKKSALEQGPLLQREKSDDANAVVVCYISTLLTFFHNFLGGGGVAFFSRIIYIQSAKEGSIVLSRTVTASDC